ncbi:restriction endonuclease subunit S [uncultured Enterococcus sp.]|uniref:restriction endonuclease subunit S n=1 Tax=uncultured Enterococcus sp. TaxID=167972 RepID=UPI002584B2BD|nr:restriction endonuclease subunit S [uncultured Enterococcus sp.]
MVNREMKYSGIEWIGEIPKCWEITKFKYVMKKDKKIAKKYNDENIISLTKSGVIIRDLENPFGKMPASFDGYQHVEEGDLLLCLFDIDVTPRCVGIVKNNGVTSPAYSRYKLMDGFDINYYNYLLTYLDDEKILLSYTKSLRNTLTDEYFGAVSTIKPSLVEQQKIAAFLNEKTSHIDNIIENTKKSIENLKAYKQSLITETVTKGLDSNVEMKDSGIEWVKKVPKHWRVNKVRYFMKEKSVKNHPNEMILSLYRDYGVVPKNSRDDNHNVTSLNTETYKLVEENELVINKMKAWQGSLAISKYEGIISPAYYIFAIDQKKLLPEFLHYMFRNPVYIDEYKRLSAGIRPGQWDLNKDEFKNVLYAYPESVQEQKKIAEFLDEKTYQIDSLINQKDKLIVELESYKKSLIYEYVTGKKEVK